MIDRIRSILFNFLFYVVLTPAICILLMPTLIMPRWAVRWTATFYQKSNYLLEKYVMNLDYEVRGIEHLPPPGTPYLVASKHQSAYETMKLMILFKDPTIILKKELLKLPIFGWFLQRQGVIALDRTNRDQAMKSLIDGAREMAAVNRPIVIYPQGTRVNLDVPVSQKPYKGGIIKLYAVTNLPIIPVALNTGLYWPRNSFWKRSGKVIFEILPPIPPGIPDKEILPMLEQIVEDASNRLIAEGRQALAKQS